MSSISLLERNTTNHAIRFVGAATSKAKSAFATSSRPKLTSRRSLLVAMFHKNDRAAAFANYESLDSNNNNPLTMKKGSKLSQDVPRSSAQPIIMANMTVTSHQAALSPKGSRRDMLQTELTALHHHLL